MTLVQPLSARRSVGKPPVPRPTPVRARRSTMACATSMDEVAQIMVVGFDVRLSGRDVLALAPEEAEVEYDLAFLRQLVAAFGILG